MVWSLLSSENTKKRVCRYLIQQYIGDFTKQKIALENLSIDVYSGKGGLLDVVLDCEKLNEYLLNSKLPFELVEGRIGSISICVPWKNLLSESISSEISGIILHVRPKPRDEVLNIDHSLFTAMTSSVEVARACLDNQPESGTEVKEERTIEGVEALAETIESVMRRLRATATDIVIRIELTQDETNKPVFLEIKVARMGYMDIPKQTAASRLPTSSSSSGSSSSSTSSGSWAALLDRDNDAFRPLAHTPAATFKTISVTDVTVLVRETITVPPQPPYPMSGTTTSVHSMYFSAVHGPVLSGGAPDLLDPPQQQHLTNGSEAPGRELLTPVLVIPGVQTLVLSTGDEKSDLNQMNVELHLTSISLLVGPTHLSHLVSLWHSHEGSFAASRDSSSQCGSPSWFQPHSMHHEDYGRPEWVFRHQAMPSASHLDAGADRDTIDLTTCREKSPASTSSEKWSTAMMEHGASSIRSDCMFKVTMARLLAVVLYEDYEYLNLSWDNRAHAQLSRTQFFDLASTLTGDSPTNSINEVSEAVSCDHLRLVTGPLALTIARTGDTEQTTFTASTPNITEYLFDLSPHHGEVLSGPSVDTTKVFDVLSTMVTGGAALEVHSQSVTDNAEYRVRSNEPDSTVVVKLPCFETELDLTIIDRLYKVIHALFPEGVSQNQQIIGDRCRNHSNGDYDVQHDVFMKLVSPFARVNLRFPKADTRSLAERRPWWKKIVQPEVLELNFDSPSVSYHLLQSATSQEYCFQFKTLQGILTLNDQESVEVLSVTQHFDSGEAFAGIDLPKVLITSDSVLQRLVPDSVAVQPDNSSDEAESAFSNLNSKQDNGPFSSTTHTEDGQDYEHPGNLSEIEDFVRRSCGNSQLSLQLFLPKLQINLYNSQVCQLLYNRIAHDLSLWTPSAPAVVPDPALNSMCNRLSSIHINILSHIFSSEEQFYAGCSVSSEDGGVGFEFRKDADERHRSPSALGRSWLAVSLNSLHASIGFYPKEIRSDEEASALGFSHTVVELSHAALHHTSSYRGDPALDYFCFAVQNLAVWTVPGQDTVVEPTLYCDLATSTQKLVPLIELAPEWLRKTSREASQLTVENSANMCSITAKVLQGSEKGRDVVVSSFLRGGLVHLSNSLGFKHLQHIRQFFDFPHYPVPGYIPATTNLTSFIYLYGTGLEYMLPSLTASPLAVLENVSILHRSSQLSSDFILSLVIEKAFLYFVKTLQIRAVSPVRAVLCTINLLDVNVSLKAENEVDRVAVVMRNNCLEFSLCSDTLALLTKAVSELLLDLHHVLLPDPGHTRAGVSELEERLEPTASIRNQASNPQYWSHNVHVDEPMMSSLVPEKELSDLLLDALTDLDLTDGHQAMNHDRRSVFGAAARPQVSSCMLHSPEEHLDPWPLSSDVAGSDTTDSNFCILDTIIPFETHVDAPPKITMHRPMKIDYTYFEKPTKIDPLAPPAHYPKAIVTFRLMDSNITLRLCGGLDFPSETLGESIPKSAAGGWSPNSSPLATPTRSTTEMLEVMFSKLRFQYSLYPQVVGQPMERFALILHELEVRDRVSTSSFNKMLHQYFSSSSPQARSSEMLTVKVLKSLSSEPPHGEEAVIRVVLMPLRLYIDQDSVNFLKVYFKTVIILLSSADQENQEPRVNTQAVPERKVFIKRFSFPREVPIRFDYHGKHIDMEQGTLIGLLVGLTQLNCSEVRLKAINLHGGILGFDRLIAHVIGEWSNDIRSKQLPSVIAGLGPMHNLLQIAQGLVDLFRIPYQQYQLDGRLVMGIQRGAQAFSSSTGIAFIDVLRHVVLAIQFTAGTAYDIVCPLSSRSTPSRLRRSVPPLGIRDGVTTACSVVSEGFTGTLSAIVDAAAEEGEAKGVTGVMGGVLRQLPATLVQPILVAAEATSSVLDGARNSLSSDGRREAMDKWRDLSGPGIPPRP